MCKIVKHKANVVNKKHQKKEMLKTSETLQPVKEEQKSKGERKDEQRVLYESQSRISGYAI